MFLAFLRSQTLLKRVLNSASWNSNVDLKHIPPYKWMVSCKNVHAVRMYTSSWLWRDSICADLLPLKIDPSGRPSVFFLRGRYLASLCTRIHICIVVRSLKKWCSRRCPSHAGHPTFHPVLSVFDTKELAKVNNKSNGCASGMPNSLWVL